MENGAETKIGMLIDNNCIYVIGVVLVARIDVVVTSVDRLSSHGSSQRDASNEHFNL
jgi:hypothetical protein